MTKFQALYVKYLRVRLGGTWRWVAGKYNNRYLDKIPFYERITMGGNQLDGIDLCNQAMDMLGEEVEDGWN